MPSCCVCPSSGDICRRTIASAPSPRGSRSSYIHLKLFIPHLTQCAPEKKRWILDFADRDAHLERGEYLLEEDHGLYASDTVTLFYIIASSHMSFLISCLPCLLTYIASLYFSIQSVSHLVSILGFLSTTVLRLHVPTSILVCPTSDIYPVSISDYPCFPSSCRGLLCQGEPSCSPPTYGASSLLGGIPHPS